MEKKELKIIREQLETRSEEVQEIMGFIPNWLIRWGISVLFITILTLLIGSYFFKYPEILNSTIIVSTKNPPASIIAKSSGKFEYIIEDEKKVKKHDILAVIENPCKFSSFNELKHIMKSISLKDKMDFERLNNIKIKKSLKLGELQNQYEQFIKAYRDYQFFIKNKLFNDEITSLNKQLDKNRLILIQSEEQKMIQRKELDLFKKKYSRAKELMHKGIISKEEFDNTRGIYLQKEYSYKGAETNIINRELQIEIIKRNIITIQGNFNEKREQLSLNLFKGFKNLNSNISIWEQKYILKSPIDGIAAFTKYWDINQNVKVGDTVLTIIPDFNNELIGRVLLAITGSGKVKSGQRLNVKFDAYPFMEYGIVSGIVKKISQIQSDDKYTIEVIFPDGLQTNYKKTLKFSQEMKGIAEIITEDISLLERLFSKFKSIIKN